MPDESYQWLCYHICDEPNGPIRILLLVRVLGLLRYECQIDRGPGYSIVHVWAPLGANANVKIHMATDEAPTYEADCQSN